MNCRVFLPLLCLVVPIACSRTPDSGRMKPASPVPPLAEISDKNADSLFTVAGTLELETTRESLIAFPFDLCVSHGEIFVASRNNEIKVFDMQGKFRRNMGSLGDGPGEYRSIGSVFSRGNDAIGVYDWSSFRLTVFTRGGEYRSSAMVPIPGLENLKSILYDHGYYYMHIPSSPAFHFHVARIDTSLSDIRGFLEADDRFAGYQDRLLFNGGLVLDTARGCLYEADSYFHGIRRINLATGDISTLEIPQPSFYIPMPSLSMPTGMEETSALFRKGTNVFNLFLQSNRYLVMEYHVAREEMRIAIIYLVYDLETSMCFTVPAGRVRPCYSDGSALYGLIYFDKNSRQREEDIVKNPVLVTYMLTPERLTSTTQSQQ